MTYSAKKGELSHNEKALFEAIKNNNAVLLRQLLSNADVCVDCLDESGMTPLQHAAFKGRSDLCELLLSHGADVNSNEHENGYTTLMFAALSGNVEATRMMLDAGAKTSPVNSVGRTAAQMAGFVGQHECVTLINNYFSIEKLEYYTKPRGFESEPKLPPELASTLHKYILHSNLHPVRLSLFLKKNAGLINEAPKVVKVLESICEKEMKSAETNDILAMKAHYLASVLQACRDWEVEKADAGINGFIKVLLKEQESNGAQIGMEKFLRESIKNFPFHESELFIQIVRNVSGVKIGNDPTAYMLLTQAINGARSVDMESPCSTCGQSKAEMKCSACKMVRYCDQNCQKLHWFTHKKRCKKLGEIFKKEEARRLKEEVAAQRATQDSGDAGGSTDDAKKDKETDRDKLKSDCPSEEAKEDEPQTEESLPISSKGEDNSSASEP